MRCRSWLWSSGHIECSRFSFFFFDKFSSTVCIARKLLQWDSVVLVEPNRESLDLAESNLRNNRMDYTVRPQEPDSLIPRLDDDINHVILANPPWFDGDRNHERETTGGEVDFASRLLQGNLCFIE